MMPKSLRLPGENEAPPPLKGKSHLLLKQVGKDGKRKWQMIWHETKVPFSRVEGFWGTIDDALAAIRHGKR